MAWAFYITFDPGNFFSLYVSDNRSRDNDNLHSHRWVCTTALLSEIWEEALSARVMLQNITPHLDHLQFLTNTLKYSVVFDTKHSVTRRSAIQCWKYDHDYDDIDIIQ